MDPFNNAEPEKNFDSESIDSDFEDDLDKSETDISAHDARNGKDIQGIPWESQNSSRDKFSKSISNPDSILYFGAKWRIIREVEQERLKVKKGKCFYDFHYNTRLVRPTIDRLVQRDLLWATTKHDVYIVHNYSIMHWSSLLRRVKEVVNMAKPIASTIRPAGSTRSLSRVQISTMAVKDNIMVIGGLHGELICKYLNQPGIAFCAKITAGVDATTNAVDVYRDHNGSLRILTGNSDAQVRVFDPENFACINQFSFNWSIYNSSVSPDGKLLAVLVRGAKCLTIADSHSGMVIGTLNGHLSASVASAWHPDGHILATGSMDTTCRVWDIRNLSKSIAVLKGTRGAIKSVKFASDGRFLAMAEGAYFVDVFDAKSGYKNCQDFVLSGEIGGISFSPDTEAFFVGIADQKYGSLLEFNRKRYNQYLDSIL